MAKLIESLTSPLAGLFIVIICTGLVQIASGGAGHIPPCDLECDQGDTDCERALLKEFLRLHPELKNYFTPQLNGVAVPKFNQEIFVRNPSQTLLENCIWLSSRGSGLKKFVKSSDETVAAWSRIRVSCLDYIRAQCNHVNRLYRDATYPDLKNTLILHSDYCAEAKLCK